jgi:hypothetical protein
MAVPGPVWLSISLSLLQACLSVSLSACQPVSLSACQPVSLSVASLGRSLLLTATHALPIHPFPHRAQEPILRQAIAPTHAAAASPPPRALTIALSPPARGAAASATSGGRAASAARALLAIGYSDGSVVLHELNDELAQRPAKGAGAARAEWLAKLRELESLVA